MVGAAAAALAVLSDDPILATSEADAVSVSGTTIAKNIRRS